MTDFGVGTAELFVELEPLCEYCLSHVKKMANELELDELIIHQIDSGIALRWTPETNKMVPVPS